MRALPLALPLMPPALPSFDMAAVAPPNAVPATVAATSSATALIAGTGSSGSAIAGSVAIAAVFAGLSYAAWSSLRGWRQRQARKARRRGKLAAEREQMAHAASRCDCKGSGGCREAGGEGSGGRGPRVGRGAGGREEQVPSVNYMLSSSASRAEEGVDSEESEERSDDNVEMSDADDEWDDEWDDDWGGSSNEAPATLRRCRTTTESGTETSDRTCSEFGAVVGQVTSAQAHRCSQIRRAKAANAVNAANGRATAPNVSDDDNDDNEGDGGDTRRVRRFGMKAEDGELCVEMTGRDRTCSEFGAAVGVTGAAMSAGQAHRNSRIRRAKKTNATRGRTTTNRWQAAMAVLELDHQESPTNTHGRGDQPVLLGTQAPAQSKALPLSSLGVWHHKALAWPSPSPLPAVLPSPDASTAPFLRASSFSGQPSACDDTLDAPHSLPRSLSAFSPCLSPSDLGRDAVALHHYLQRIHGRSMDAIPSAKHFSASSAATPLATSRVPAVPHLHTSATASVSPLTAASLFACDTCLPDASLLERFSFSSPFGASALSIVSQPPLQRSDSAMALPSPSAPMAAKEVYASQYRSLERLESRFTSDRSSGMDGHQRQSERSSGADSAASGTSRASEVEADEPEAVAVAKAADTSRHRASIANWLQVRMRWSVVRDGGAVCGVVSGADDEATDSTAAKLGRATFACGARAGAEEAAETVALSRELSVRQIVRLVSSDQQGRLV